MTSLVTVHRLPGKFDFGAYAEVFFVNGRALKVFKRRTDADDQHVRRVYESEVGAYEIAGCHEQLRAIVPEFFGRVWVGDVLNEAGNSIASQFILDCAYEMEFVKGCFVKLGSLDSQKHHQMQNLFFPHGVLHLRDASVVLSSNGDIVAMVDFALMEYELEGDGL